MDKKEARKILGTALAAIYLGGWVLDYYGVRPRSKFASDIIPVGEPSLLDWVSIGGILFLA